MSVHVVYLIQQFVEQEEDVLARFFPKLFHSKHQTNHRIRLGISLEQHTVELGAAEFDVPPRALPAVLRSMLVVEVLFGRPDSNIS